jgi:prevent-host-death family protein
METVNMHKAKTNLSKLVAKAAKGEPFIIARAGKPLVKVVAIEDEPKVKKRIGFLDGQFKVPDDFDTMGAAAIEEMFYGKQD